MIRLIFQLLLICSLSVASAQTNCHISGTINKIEKGYLKLVKNIENNELATSVLYQGNQFPDTIQVNKHLFTISGYILQPALYRLINVENDFITEPFFIDTGYQNITFQQAANHNPFDVGWGVAVTNSAVQNAYLQYLNRFTNVNKNLLTLYDTTDCEVIKYIVDKKNCFANFEFQRNRYRNQKDSILIDYINTHPTSSINPWILYWQINKMGYRSCYATLLQEKKEAFTPAILKVFTEFLQQLRTKTIGEPFPLLHFIQAKVPEWKQAAPAFTLVDFWYSSCSPCIGQFKLLKPIYNQYHAQGFEIIAITTDAASTLQQYKAVLAQQQYSWKQCIDTAGKQAQSIYIQSYPSNFLNNQ
ncbi:TlpA disulfide reductase family protein [Hydrotalea sp.]|uniref:TlpA family protein disulfide reductase n=1 Tax=Hydrotalea sp. TaxID=2881279 RepID=UPI002587DDEA|nr:TlpA disulfide reductase family protein [Hydrotalea sp.]